MALPNILDPFRANLFQAGAQRPNQGMSRSKRGIRGFQFGSGLFQVEIKRSRRDVLVDELPCLLTDRQERQARRQHERFLRAGHANIDAPIIHAAFHGAQAAYGINHVQHVRRGN